MSFYYPMKKTGRFGLLYGVTDNLVHKRYGCNLGAQYYKDIRYRIETTMEIDRLLFSDFGKIGIGYENPFARCSIEPFGHRFMPAMYGTGSYFDSGEAPSAIRKHFNEEDIRNLEPWTLERFEKAGPVREVLEQADYVFKHCDPGSVQARSGYNPHFTPLSSLQNLGSVINTAVSIYGEDILYLYADDTKLLKKFYKNITELILLCLDFFPRYDGRTLEHVFIGNCYAAMISPAHYMECNFDADLAIVRYAESIKADFLMHQDSDANQHLPGYKKLGYLHALDLGQDTDFEKLHALFPDCRVNCILFPAWLQTHSLEDIREEILRIMRIGAGFPAFSFSLLEIDRSLGEGKIFGIDEVIKSCSQMVQDNTFN